MRPDRGTFFPTGNSVVPMLFPVPCQVVTATAAAGEAFKNFAAGAASIATFLAVIAGGVWAYYRFIRSRTFRPRFSVEICGQWRLHPKAYVFHVRVRVTNIGAAKVTLQHWGTGLRISFPSDQQPAYPNCVDWEGVAFRVLEKHDWLEPGETVSDELLLDLGRNPTVAMVEVELNWRLRRKGVEVFARRIIPPDSEMIDNA